MAEQMIRMGGWPSDGDGAYTRPCEGAGLPAQGETNYKVGTCPVCRGNVPVEIETREVDGDSTYVEVIDPHTVRVFDLGGDEVMTDVDARRQDQGACAREGLSHVRR